MAYRRGFYADTALTVSRELSVIFSVVSIVMILGTFQHRSQIVIRASLIVILKRDLA